MDIINVIEKIDRLKEESFCFYKSLFIFFIFTLAINFYPHNAAAQTIVLTYFDSLKVGDTVDIDLCCNQTRKNNRYWKIWVFKHSESEYFVSYGKYEFNYFIITKDTSQSGRNTSSKYNQIAEKLLLEDKLKLNKKYYSAKKYEKFRGAVYYQVQDLPPG